MSQFLDLEPRFWRDGAACFDHPQVDFFAAPESSADLARAKVICASCPVRDDCLAFAIETNQPDGVWGGLTAKERTRVRRRWLEDYRRAS